MKNLIAIGLVLVGMGLVNGNLFGFQLPKGSNDGSVGFGVKDSGSSSGGKFDGSVSSSSSGSNDGGFGFGVSGSNSKGKFQGSVSSSGSNAFKPQIPSLPSLSGSNGPQFSLPGINSQQSSQPQIPNLPQFSQPQIPNLLQNSSLPQFSQPQIPNIFQNPQIPGLPQFSQPSMPQIPGFSSPNFPDLSSIFNGSNAFNNGNIFGLPNISNNPFSIFNSSSKGSGFGNIFGIPSNSGLNSLLSNGTVDSALANFESSVGKSSNESRQRLDGVSNGIQSFASNASRTINEQVNQAISQLNNTLSALQKDVRSCVESQGNPPAVAINTARNQAEQCVKNKVNEALSIVNGAKNDVNSARLGAQYVRGNLSNCQLNVSMSLTDLPKVSAPKMACIASALLSIQADTLFLPINIAVRATEAITLVNTLQSYAARCVTSLVEQVARQTMNTSLAVAKCYADQQAKY